MAFTNFASHLLSHVDHLWVKVANPVHFVFIVPVVYILKHFFCREHKGTIHALPLMFRNYAKKNSKSLAICLPELVPEKFNFTKPIKFSIHVLEDLVDLRKRKIETDGFALKKTKV